MNLVTPRLILRDLRPEDAAPLARMWSDPLVTLKLGGSRNEAEVRASLEADAAVTPKPALDLWPVVEKASGEVVGHCGLLEKEVDGQPAVELVCVFMRKVWGMGYASEAARAVVDHAFNVLGLKRIVALIEPGNDASVRVVMNVGMHFEKNTLRPGERLVWMYSAGCPEKLPQNGHAGPVVARN